MKHLIKLFFVLLASITLCGTYVSCVSTNIQTQIVDIDENPDSEFYVDARWLKSPMEVQFVKRVSKGSNKTYQLLKEEIVSTYMVYPKSILRIRFNAQSKAEELFHNPDPDIENPTKWMAYGLKSMKWGTAAGYSYLLGKSRHIKLNSEGRNRSGESLIEDKKFKL